MTTDPGDPVLDPAYGSGTTACVAEEWGRCWIATSTFGSAKNQCVGTLAIIFGICVARYGENFGMMDVDAEV